jgi:MYXO-CTERM domain-containing protein
MDEVWEWHGKLAQMGTRYTGSPGHVRFTDWLQQQFSEVRDFQPQPADRIIFQRWLAQDWSLSIDQDATVGPSGPVQVSYYYPYSGTTGPGGISGRLVDLGMYTHTPEFWAPATGEIALVKVPPPSLSLDIGQTPTGGFEPGKTSQEAALDYAKYASLVTNPVFQGVFAPVKLLDAKYAGVRGVICVWTGMSDDQVANQYNPFTTPYPNSKGVPVPDDPGCPALWVGESTGRSLARSAATGQAKVTLTLTASITPDAATETVWGVLPGSDADHQRGLIVNTHTDGPNVPQENGALGMLALARYFAGRQRRRDLYFVMVTGHFQLAQEPFLKEIPNARAVIGRDAISRWMHDHPAVYQNALAGLTLEHLGCTMWADNANGQYAPTGGYEWSTTYTTQKQGTVNKTNLERQAYLAAVQDTNGSGDTAHPVVTVLPGPLPIFVGEGAPLYAGGLGTVSMCPLPSYVLQAGSRSQPDLLNLDKLDKRLIYGQILSFARTISALDAAAATDF